MFIEHHDIGSGTGKCLACDGVDIALVMTKLRHKLAYTKLSGEKPLLACLYDRDRRSLVMTSAMSTPSHARDFPVPLPMS